MDNLFQKKIGQGTERNKWVDVVRGVCVFLVVTGHLTNNEVFHIYANQIKMPLFYVLTGLFIKPDKKPLRFIKDSAFRLGIPWLIFSLVWVRVPMEFLMKKSGDAVGTLIDFVSGNSFWFVPSFFVTQILFMLLYKVCRGNKIFLSVGAIGFFAIGYFTADVSWLGIWCVNTALSGVVFILIGYLMRDYSSGFDRIKPVYAVIGAGAYLLLGFIGYKITPSASLDFHKVQYGNLPLNILLILVGIAASVTVSVCLCRKFKLTALSILGQNTLVTYLLSTTVIAVLERGLQMFGIPMKQIMNHNVVLAIAAGLLICAVCTVISEICGRVFPWSVGLRRSKSR